MISVLIPAKNEIHLQRTIDDCIAKARGTIEIIPVCDGYNPKLKKHPLVHPIYNKVSIGQRPAINQAARVAKGEFLLKCDAHCIFDEGFDIKLSAVCEHDWTVIPRMCTIDETNWKPKFHKMYDCMFFRSPYAKEHPFRIDYYDRKIARDYPEEYKAYKKAAWRQGEVCDTMASLGAVWFMYKDRFFELEGMDENHGHWGQMGVELGCKSWLSGGRQVINKTTWVAHLWRPKAPWTMTQKQVDRARDYSIDFWLNNRWPKQIYPLSWLIEKFAPVPTWNGHLKTLTSDLTLLYYTSNRISEHFRDKVLDQLQYACKSPIVSVSQEPFNLGHNICVGKIGVSLQNIYKQIYEGLKHVKTEYVALCEDDCLYVPEHFNFRPKHIAYNLNRWLLHEDLKLFSYRNRPILSQCIAPTEVLKKCLEPRMKIDVPKKYSGEPGLFENKLGIAEFPYETFETKEPNIVVCHSKNTSGRKLIGKDAEPKSELPPWGNAQTLLDILFTNINEVNKMAKFGRGAKYRSQHSYIGSIIFSIDEIMNELNDFEDPRRPGRGAKRTEVFQGIVQRIADGEILDDKKLMADPCYDYFMTLHHRNSKEYAHKRSIQLMKEWKILYHDIKDNGLKNPLDMWRIGTQKLVLHRGWRRLIIMNELHKRGLKDFSRIPVRVYKDIHIYRKYNQPPSWISGPLDSCSIHSHAQKQFMELGCYATDKYWVHGYTQQYDRHFNHLRSKKIKLLEIGVLRGASLLLWKDVFENGFIYGIDKNTQIWKKFLQGQERIKVFVGRQEDEKFLKEQVVPSGPYDIIIDDGGHTPEEQLTTFKSLWPHVAPKGIYVIEDLHGNYWNRRVKNGPKMIERIKELVDEVVGTNKSMNTYSISCYYNICFIEKN